MDKDSEIPLCVTFYNSAKVRLSPKLATGDEWDYYSLDGLNITNFKLTMKFKIYSRTEPLRGECLPADCLLFPGQL